MSLKYQNSEFIVIHFGINSTSYFSKEYALCSLIVDYFVPSKITIPGCLLWLQRHYKLSSEKAMNQIKVFENRKPPIQKALLSQRHIGISSSYCELYTKTMYKSIGKKVCCYISVYLLWINIWFYELWW